MEHRIKRLFKRLAFLGYGSFEISYIIHDAAGGNILVRLKWLPF